MAEEDFLRSLGDLTGKVAVVTGGTQGLGWHTSVYLALRGASVYACAPDTQADRDGIASAQKALSTRQNEKTSANDFSRGNGLIVYHELDLASVRSAKRGLETLKARIQGERQVEEESGGEKRLDILVGNAGIMFPPLDKLSEDGFERTFAVCCLGHFVFVNGLLDLIESTASSHGQARITMVTSEAYKFAAPLDKSALTTLVPDDQTSILQLKDSFQRYCNAKLGVLHFALELDKRLKERGVEGVLTNACHPGRAGRTTLGDHQQKFMSPKYAQMLKFILSFGFLLNNTTEDTAKTQVFLSASDRIGTEKVRGEYWVPVMSWRLKYLGSQKEELTGLGQDEGEWSRFWETCEEAVEKATLREQKDLSQV